MAPIAPSAWPPREVKSSAQTTAARPSIVPQPPTWLAGVKSATSPVVVVAGEAGEAADLAEASRGRAAASMRSRQVSLPRLRWRTTPGSSEPGASARGRGACSARDLVEHGAQVSRPPVARRRRRLARRRPARSRRRPGRRRRCRRRRVGASAATTPAQGAVTVRLHLHGAHDHQRVAGRDGVAGGARDLDDRAAHAGVRRPRGPVAHRQRPAPAARWRRRGRAEGCGLLVEQRERARRRPGRRRQLGASASRVVRGVAGADLGVGEDGPQLRAGWSAGRRSWNSVQRAAGAVDGAEARSPRS